MVDLSVDFAGVKLKNPIIPASGVFGFGREFAEVYDLNVLGSFCLKGTTLEPRFGNPLPRIAETPSGMLNAVGLQNPGIDVVINDEIPYVKSLFSGPIIANVGGFSSDEYTEICRKLNDVDAIKIIEVNISCPNVHDGGKNFGSSAQTAYSITKAVREVTDKPIVMKLSPNVTDIAEIARACEEAGADGICLINTLLGMRIDLKTRKPILANRTGGLSGPAILPVALRMVWDVYEAVKIPIIGCGGVSNENDVCEMMLAGATAVEVGAANLKNPFACLNIVNNLPRVCEKLKISKLSELTGAAH